MAQQQQDHYEVLGLDRTASSDDIKRAYKKLAIQCHPDKNPGDATATERFKRLTHAYNVLSDERRRRMYDRNGQDEPDDTAATTAFDDVLRSMFGDFGGFGPMFVDPAAAAAQQARQADVLQVHLPLGTVLTGGPHAVDHEVRCVCTACKGHGAMDICDIVQCVTCRGTGMLTQQLGPFAITSATCPSCFGRRQVIRNGRQCHTCRGERHVMAKKRLQVEVPLGVAEGHRIHLASKGHYNHDRREYNDLVVVVAYHTPPGVQVLSNRDVQVQVTLTLDEVLCGFRKDITTDLYGPGNPVSIGANGYTQPTKLVALPKLGLPVKPGSPERSNLLIRFSVVYPSSGERLNKYQDALRKIFKHTATSQEEPCTIMLQT